MRRALRLSLAAYAGLLVAPAATLGPGPTWPLFAAGAVVGALASTPVTARLDRPDSVVTLPRMLVGFAVPLGWIVPALDGAESAPDVLFSQWFAGALASLGWLVAVVVAHEWQTRERIDALTERAVFEARNPPETRRQLRIAAGVVIIFAGAVAVGSFAFGFGDDSGTFYWWFPAMVPVWLPIFAGPDGRGVTVADEGLRVERQIHGWETFDGYELTDDALLFSRTGWYRTTLSFDRDDIEDLDAVTAALDEFVERH